MTKKKKQKKTEPLEKSNMVNLKNLTSNSVWDSFYLQGESLPCAVYCIVNEQTRSYQSSITCYNVVCGPPGLHAEVLSPGLEGVTMSLSALKKAVVQKKSLTFQHSYQNKSC